MMKVFRILLPILLCIMLSALPAVTGDAKQEKKPDPEKVDKAIEKAVEYIRKLQQKDGSWKFPGMSEDRYPMGVTAFATLALVKGGVPPNDPAISRALKFIFKEQQFRKVYSVSVLILLLEALYTPPPPKDPKKLDRYISLGPANIAAEAWRRYASSTHKRKLKDAVAWLISKQEPQKKMWRYPEVYVDEPCPEDASNSQYAMLAIAAARRLGCKVPDTLYNKVIEWFIEAQEKDGPDVNWFPVPGADKSIRDLLKHAEKIRKALKKKKRDEDATSVLDQAEPLYKTDETYPMKARGWGYAAPGVLSNLGFDDVSGSMTASGICCLMIAKEALGAKLRGERAEKVDQAMRDGCAWLEKHWTVTNNPGKTRYQYYYLYSVQRACQLSLTQRIGEHDWYVEGAELLLSTQQPDGSWNKTEHLSSLTNTCFSILFLRRATIPVVKMPGVIYTGKEFMKKKEMEEKKKK
ncbi:MAG: prenyltransferase/squalene oxidase repeat-containing protein [Planctomycetota bacterium]|jgi:hypothetical protein